MSIEPFNGHKYLNLETFRKSGAGVRTPVWFVREEDVLHVWTQAGSGKVKRIRNNAQVRIAPCKADGALLGEWTLATAHVEDTPEAVQHVTRLMRRKYGLLFLGFHLMNKLRRVRIATLRIHVKATAREE